MTERGSFSKSIVRDWQLDYYEYSYPGIAGVHFQRKAAHGGAPARRGGIIIDDGGTGDVDLATT